MKKKLINLLVAYTQKKVDIYKTQNRAILDSVSEEITNTVEIENHLNVWSVSTNGGPASNVLHVKDERELLKSIGLPRMTPAITRVDTEAKDGKPWQFGPTTVNRGSTVVFGGVTKDNYNKLQKVTKKIRFWEKVKAKLLSF